MRSRISIVVMVLCLIFSMAFTAYAAPMTDTQNHWAKEQINSWVEKGLISGYEDGTFRPDNNITRAEFMALVNRVFNYQEKAEIDYKDVADTAWYADAVKIARAAGYISGYENGTMKPDNPISRQEAATIIMKILRLEENTSGADKFNDAAGIPAWSKGAVGAVASAGIMGGYPDGTFKAANLIKRAEAVVALDKALSSKVDVIYDKAGTYGPSTGSEEIKGNVIISAAKVNLQNLVIEGNLTIDKAVGDGDVHLKQVTVKGDTYIYGGGKDSIYFIDSQTGKTYVLKDDGPVRIVVSGTTEINEIIAQSGLTVEEVNLTGEGIEGIIVDKKVDGNIEINLKGVNVESLEINTAEVTVTTDINTVIDKLAVNKKADFRGSGTIKYADINADNVTFEKMPGKYEVAEGVNPPTIYRPSSGGGGISKVAVSAISVLDQDGNEIVEEVFVGETLTAKVTPTGATVNYQWQRADAEDGEYEDIDGATEETYKLVDADVGK